MILKSNRLFYGAFLLCLPSLISADLTTLQSWDPYPIFNALNLNTPPDTQFCTIIKRKIIDETPGKRRKIGINLSPFIQRAVRAQKGPGQFYGDYSLGIDTGTGQPLPKPTGTELSDYQGTPYLMGLFLGKNQNGANIWVNGTDNANVTNITLASITTTGLPANLQSALAALNDCSTGTAGVNAIIYDTPTSGSSGSWPTPSILSQSVLEQDQTYFGAISIPLVYQKIGLRWEANFDISDNFGFIFQGGACQISQTAGRSFSLSNSLTAGTNSIYELLNSQGNTANPQPSFPVTGIQSIFNEWVTNNTEDLLAPKDGVDYDIDTFTKSGFEDFRFLFFARHVFAMDPKEEGDFASMLITPYAIFGYTAPLTQHKDYSKLYALPIGNNGHQSLGGIVGITFDFIDTVEIGFKGGATFFLPQLIENMPVPNHELQRVLYPYRRDVNYAPGFNWQFGANLNAIEFIKNISFLFTYDYIEHTRDSITQVLTQTGNKYFFPEMLEELSPWASQMFTAALDFKLQPGIFLSLAWQGALSQTNAYCSNTILGSLNFLF